MAADVTWKNEARSSTTHICTYADTWDIHIRLVWCNVYKAQWLAKLIKCEKMPSKTLYGHSGTIGGFLLRCTRRTLNGYCWHWITLACKKDTKEVEIIPTISFIHSNANLQWFPQIRPLYCKDWGGVRSNASFFRIRYFLCIKHVTYEILSYDLKE